VLSIDNEASYSENCSPGGLKVGMAKHKISRLHYVRGTAEEAKYTAEANHSNKRWKAGQRGSSWYSSHTPPGYATYEQFRNGNYFGTL